MILLAVLALLLLAGLLAAGARRHSAAVLASLAVLVLLAAAEGPVAQRLLDPLQAPYLQQPAAAWRARNVIVVLGAGTVRPPGVADADLRPGLFAYSRLLAGVELYRACAHTGAVCKLLLSGGDPLHLGQAEASSYAREVLALGVPAADLVLESRSRNTRENAAFSAPLIAAIGPDQVLLVSSGYHLRRASALFRHYQPALRVVAADALEPGPGWLPSSFNLALSEVAVHEWLGLGRDRLWPLP